MVVIVGKVKVTVLINIENFIPIKVFLFYLKIIDYIKSKKRK